MTTPLAQPAGQERAALQDLIVTLAYAQGIETAAEALLAFPGITRAGVGLLLEISQVRRLARLNPPPGAHAAVQAVNRQNLMRRAAYLVAAARRLSTAARADEDTIGRALTVERRWLAQHLQATAQRATVAAGVASVARQQARAAKQEGSTWNGLLGWYAVNDTKTSAECRAAHGRDFDPTHVPPIGFPGSVHGSCRCTPGPPFNSGRRVERLMSRRRESGDPSSSERVKMGA